MDGIERALLVVRERTDYAATLCSQAEALAGTAKNDQVAARAVTMHAMALGARTALGDVDARIRALPRSEWRADPPTRDELRAHAAAYGDGGMGMWVFQARKGKSWGEPMIVWVSEDDPPMWQSWAVTTRCRPTTDDGTPVPWPEVKEAGR